MDAALVRFFEAVARPIALALFHSLWQGGIIGGLVAAGLLLLRRRSATLRYGVACVGLLALLTMTVATAVWFVRHPAPPTATQVVWRKALAASDAGAGASVSESPDATPAFAVGAAPEDRGTPVEEGRANPRLIPAVDMELAGPWVFTGWVAGVLMLAALHLHGWRRVRELKTACVDAIPRAWRDRLAVLSRSMGLLEPVRALASKRVTVPTVVGCLRPVILIPSASFTELTASDLELILIHELAHVRRHDVLINYIQTAAETLLFYHPAVWWISRRIRIEREHCCDDAAVRATGDGVAYARALSEVEHMRERIPSHAMAADGGAFRNRIRRLIGVAPSATDHRRAGLAGVVVITLVVGLTVPAMTAAPGGEASAKAPEPAASRWSDIEGEWRAEGFGGSIRVHFDLPDWGECSLTFDDDNFGESRDGAYTLERDAGTFILEGSRLPRKWRKALFRADAAYAESMRELGYDIENEGHLLELAIHDVTLAFARGIAAAGFDVSRSRLVEFRIHDVTPEYVQALADVGYDQLTPSRIVEFKIHGVEPEYVERMAVIGYEELTPARIVEFRIHGVEPEYVERMAAIGYEELTPARIVEFRIHGVTPQFVRGLAEEGYGPDDVSPARIVEFAIHGVSPEFIRRLRRQGITDVAPAKLVEYKIVGVPRRESY